ncbi:MAG: YdcF family protein [Xanthobacteraceae bacterium]
MSESMTGARTEIANAPGAPRRRVRVWRLAGIAAVAGLVALAAGFVWYASLVSEEATSSRSAEAIVALTGGPERIGEAVEQLAAGRGQRLLITGVNRGTHADTLARLVPRYEALFACCIDIDHSAINTIGNAIETRRWARDHGFHSLMVVTSGYHMPRALAEIAHQLPDVTLVPFPVITEHQRAEPWWASVSSARMVAAEYLKYLVAITRIRLDAGGRLTKMASGNSGTVN